MRTTLSNLENATNNFKTGDISDKVRILHALGQNPTLTDGVLAIDEHYWLVPVKNNASKLTEALENVRTAPQQMKNSLEKAIFKQWCWE